MKARIYFDAATDSWRLDIPKIGSYLRQTPRQIFAEWHAFLLWANS